MDAVFQAGKVGFRDQGPEARGEEPGSRRRGERGKEMSEIQRVNKNTSAEDALVFEDTRIYRYSLR